MKRTKLSVDEKLQIENKVNKLSEWKAVLYDKLQEVEIIPVRTSIPLSWFDKKNTEEIISTIENVRKNNRVIEEMNFKALLNVVSSFANNQDKNHEINKVIEKTNNFETTFVENCGSVENITTTPTPAGFRICWNSIKLITKSGVRGVNYSIEGLKNKLIEKGLVSKDFLNALQPAQIKAIAKQLNEI